MEIFTHHLIPFTTTQQKFPRKQPSSLRVLPRKVRRGRYLTFHKRLLWVYPRVTVNKYLRNLRRWQCLPFQRLLPPPWLTTDRPAVHLLAESTIHLMLTAELLLILVSKGLQARMRSHLPIHIALLIYLRPSSTSPIPSSMAMVKARQFSTTLLATPQLHLNATDSHPRLGPRMVNFRHQMIDIIARAQSTCRPPFLAPRY